MKTRLTKTIVLILCFIFNYSAISQSFTLNSKIIASDRKIGDRLGISNAINDNYAVTTSYMNDYDINDKNYLYNSGSAYVYKKNSAKKWIQIQKLNAKDRSAGAQFGLRVAISDKYLVISSDLDDLDENGINPIKDAGSVYIFELDENKKWVQKQKIVAKDRRSGDNFGYSISISDDNIAIGAFYNAYDIYNKNFKSHAGAAYVFNKNSKGIWVQKQKLIASDRANNDQFGYSISISKSVILIGAATSGLNDAGAAYIFEKDKNGIWSQKQKLEASDKVASDHFGRFLTLDKYTAVIGSVFSDYDKQGKNLKSNAGAAYVFERDKNGKWNQKQKLLSSEREENDYFGWNLSIYGKNLIIGSFRESHDLKGKNFISLSGSAYLFSKNTNGLWEEKQKLVAFDRNTNNQFGYDVCIFKSSIILGAFLDDNDTKGNNYVKDAGSAYIFELPSTDLNNFSKNAILTIYPNPTQNKLHFKTKSVTNRVSSFIIFDGQGKEIYHSSLKDMDNFEIKTNNLNRGIYHIKFIYKSGFEYHSFIKK